jgi:hypothetical protein
MNNKLKKDGKIRGRIVKADYSWVDKTNLNDLPDVPLENKVTAEDMNYLKGAIDSMNNITKLIQTDENGDNNTRLTVSLSTEKWQHITWVQILVEYNDYPEIAYSGFISSISNHTYLNNAMNTKILFKTIRDENRIEITIENTIKQPIITMQILHSE